MSLLDAANQVTEDIVGIVDVLPALKDGGAKVQLIALVAAVQNLFLAQAVTLDMTVGPAQSAIIAIVLAVGGELDEAAEVDLLAVVGLADLAGVAVGVNLFVSSGISGCKLANLSKSVLPMIGLMLLVLLVITYFPQVPLCLVSGH